MLAYIIRRLLYAIPILIGVNLLTEVLVTRLLQTEQLWVLVEEIARSEAVADAINRQSLGFADQVADEVRERSGDVDAWLERAARRVTRRRRAEPPPEPHVEEVP